MINILIAKDGNKVREILSDLLKKEGCIFTTDYEGREGALYRTVMEKIEKPLIENILERTEGNQLKAARILGMNRNTIRSKIKKLNIDLSRWKAR